MLRKTCPRCGAIIEMAQTYCEQCQQEADKQKQERQIRYDTEIRYKRDKKYHDFYNSLEWEKVRQAAVARDHALCQDCLKQHRIKPYDTVHHIEPIKDNWGKRLDLNNLICLCESCHQERHKQLKG
ncbi:HNH endonuclease signature motif containing protein [Tepidanaerobacter sp. EBM-49]|uniref:HNH endonuclease n=1 Tax=Tepidanaerobacter sp. EBM-49 TaxID=1918504 RepID=UPI00257E810C|nr:HNH endonuclease signature motif containing protein [Tepidanaerobacter sp. EBM-49]